MSSTMITLQYRSQLYNIEAEPFETVRDSYKRAWYIVKNYDNYSYDELYSQSLMLINREKGMQY